ncbi:Bola-like protein 3 [Plakobranchus ocellatus]|uniref:Bola-like protein 3 n=1 Tax=Plakobranchus ocellatus TaxID=259542 RepID=A0AAV3XXC3_9GAST|nr:Bola-like protein 3 [Plakobranchus ocellatus]
MLSVMKQLFGQVHLSAVRAVSTTYSTPYIHAFSTSTPNDSEDKIDLTAGEKQLMEKINRAFPDATHVQVSDVSGGCGAMYQISIESPQFQGKRTIQQHRMVNEALAEDIKNMHGLQLNTKAPEAK